MNYFTNLIVSCRQTNYFTSLAKLVTAIAFEAIDYWFESNKMLWLSIIFNLSTKNFRLIKLKIVFLFKYCRKFADKERSINWLVWRSPKSSVGVRVTSLLIFFCQLQTLRCIKRKIYRALSLIGRVPNCQLGLSQFESGRARKSVYNLSAIIELYIYIFFSSAKKKEK